MPLEKNTDLVNLFAEKGCLIRMVKDAKAEIKALDENEAGGNMVRPSTLIQTNILIPTEKNIKSFGIFIHPRCSKAAYKQQTISNFIPTYIKDYHEQKIQMPLLNYLIARMNKADGTGKGKKALKNLSIDDLHDKLAESSDRASGKILDINSKSYLRLFLLKISKQSPNPTHISKEDFEKFISHESIPDYLKRQMNSKFNEYIAKLGRPTIQELIDYIDDKQAIKKANWTDLQFRINHIIDTSKPEGMFGPEHIELKGPVDLNEAISPHLSAETKSIFLKEFHRLYPEATDQVSYEQIIACFGQLQMKLDNEEDRYMEQDQQYTQKEKESYRKVEVNECIAVPLYEDILAIHFHPEMNKGDWEQALGFQKIMKAKGHELSFFTYNPDSPNEKLLGPFSLEEASKLWNSCHTEQKVDQSNKEDLSSENRGPHL